MSSMADRKTNTRRAAGPIQRYTRGLMSGRFLQLIFIIAVGTTARESVFAEPPSSASLEYQVKAAFLCNFIKFVDWPGEVLSDTDNTIIIGVLGESPINAALESIEGKKISGYKLDIKHFKKAPDLEFCHILFVSSSAKGGIEEVLKMLKGSSTLTVSEVAGFTRLGGMINFIIIDNTVRFEINVKRAEKADLKISSKLLRLARIVQEKK